MSCSKTNGTGLPYVHFLKLEYAGSKKTSRRVPNGCESMVAVAVAVAIWYLTRMGAVLLRPDTKRRCERLRPSRRPTGEATSGV